MEAKKSKKANLENKKTIFIQIGLIISLAVVLSAFEYKSYERFDVIVGNGNVGDLLEEMIPITVHKVEAPKHIAPKSVTVINIVDGATEDLPDIDINDEADQNTIIEDYLPPVEDEIIDEAPLDFLKVESKPSFPGGEYARKKFLAENLKYPRMAKESGIQGKVFIGFVVELDGSISNVTLLRGIGGGCDEESLRVTKLMPRWIPGKQRGKTVRVMYKMPIKFTLQQQ